MPKATAPIGKPAAAAKPTGFVKPGLSRQTGSSKAAEAEEDDEPQGLRPVLLGISGLALLVSGLFAYTAYSTDQTPNRASEDHYLLGKPSASEAAGDDSYSSSSASSSVDDDDDDDDASSSSSDSSADSGDDEDEEEDDE